MLGVFTGLVGGSFARATLFVTSFRLRNRYLLLLLPLGGIPIHLLYKKFNDEVDEGSNLVVKALNRDADIPPVYFPLIYISAVFSHLIGASVGRVGTTMQLGGSIGNYLSAKYSLNKEHKNIIIMASVAGVLSAMFGTPVCAALFSVELAKVLKPNLRALIPALITSFTARFIGSLLGIGNAHYEIGEIPGFDFKTLILCLGIGIIAGLVGLLYVFSIYYLKNRLSLLIPNFILRCLIFGTLLLVLSLIFKGQTFNGMGSQTIRAAFRGEVLYYAFFVKIIFTTISFVAGYKGGEIFPAIFIGATLGATFGNIIGVFPGFFAGLSTGAIFAAITNCPLAALALSIEFFGPTGAIYFVIVIVVGFLVSGPRSLYPAQEYSLSSKNSVN